MRLVTFRTPEDVTPRLGALVGPVVVHLPAAQRALRRPGPAFPDEMLAFLEAGEPALDEARALLEALGSPQGDAPGCRPRDAVELLAPLPRPRSLRDCMTYEAHVSGSSLGLPPAWYEMPVYYKGNPASVIGPGAPIVHPCYTDQLDFELELAFVIGREGRNVPLAQARRHVVGATIFNDVSARDIQFREMEVKLGPSKGKDFCNVLGPCIATLDEIDDLGLGMRAWVNGEQWSAGHSSGRRYSLEELVAWVSFEETIHPGDVIGVGTVPTGCGLELGRFLKPGDVVELEIDGIGRLRNPVGPKAPWPEGFILGTPARRAATRPGR